MSEEDGMGLVVMGRYGRVSHPYILFEIPANERLETRPVSETHRRSD